MVFPIIRTRSYTRNHQRCSETGVKFIQYIAEIKYLSKSFLYFSGGQKRNPAFSAAGGGVIPGKKPGFFPG
ncbi:Uncharacterized protein dnm_068520 [Desulfonema magnum]|uniref:Uncharacterized protein n=1 Tax=Desulfonema magnum TaxID=45655 RepID=A0A975GR92_9BACT|nr:Uncharacterized protein dnm_068520 [Desulfonema magnum]